MEETIIYLKSILNDNDIVVIGLSGGADSMCLLDILNKIDINIKIICAHINHNIRKESDNELAMLEKYCHDKNIIIETTKFSKKSETQDYSEAELREKRYAFFKTIINKYDAKYLFTAHHGDDLVETILMRLSRGSDIKGYSGFQIMSKKDNYTLVKPLIYTTKEEIIEYNKINKIPYFEDKTNSSYKYTRNRYRHKILPILKEENNNIHLKYLKFSRELIKNYEYVYRQVDKELSKRYKNNILDITNYELIDKFILENMIKKILDINYPDNLFLVSDKHTNFILDIIKNPKPNITINLPDNLYIRKRYNKLTITRENNKKNNYHIILNQSIILPDNHVIEYISDNDDNSNYTTRINSKEISLPLFVRNRESGDKMIIKNMKNNKKIKDIFIDSKLPQEKRDTQPIVVDSNGTIIWLPGLKKSKFDKSKNENYDIILWYN